MQSKWPSNMSLSEVETKIKELVLCRLEDTEYQAFLFGSRATGTAKKWSDYDVGILGKKPLDSVLKVTIEEDLENSNVPYFVDIVDFYKVTDRFKTVAMKGAIPWKK